MHPELVTTFIDEFHREVNRQTAEQDGRRDRTERDLEKTEREIRRVIEAIKAGRSRRRGEGRGGQIGKPGGSIPRLNWKQHPHPCRDCTPTLPRCTVKRS